ncbi:MAG TPA: DEAD/DEAH box helicase family protein [Burkholderiaceae bacterium]|nr:DEAD/DEAH box helicase family protein [Burkholderiaceae bacterium]
MSVPLRDYQGEAVEQARAAIRAGAKNVLIVAPTAAGKTTIAAHLIDECVRKGKRAAFVVDRLSLIQQTSDTFDRHSIDHGVIQADHPRFRPGRPVQICSVQTVARRMWPEAQLIVVDEAHTVTETVKKRIMPRDTVTLGLTATPFTKGLGQLYDAVVNVTTTHRLIEQGWLSPYRIFSCVEPDMEGVKLVAGEFDAGEAQTRALKVVGDVVAEYLQHGASRKFICSAVDTAHVEELQRQFLAAGIHVATYTYRDRNEDRNETVAEFRRSDSRIQGLITVTAASKGFDVPDISCVIMARPLRRSLAEHIQFFGRGLRIAEGKSDCLVLDHSGNCARFWNDMQTFFEEGAVGLNDGRKKEAAKPQDKPEAELVKCPHCRHMHRAKPFCPNCGHEYPKKRAVEHVPGTLKELLASGNRSALSETLWPQVCGYARDRRGDEGRGMALALYRQMTGLWPRGRFEDTAPCPPSREVLNKIRSLNIAYARRRQLANATGAQAVPA